MDNYLAWFKRETDKFKETYCTQVDNYYDRVFSQMKANTASTGNESPQELSEMMCLVEKTNTYYKRQLSWLSRRYFASQSSGYGKSTFDANSSAINNTTSFTNPIILSNLNNRDSYQVNTVAEYATNQLQQANTNKRSDASEGMPKDSNVGFLRLDSLLSGDQFVSLSPSNHNIDSQSMLPWLAVARVAPFEQRQKSASMDQSGNQNVTDIVSSVNTENLEFQCAPGCVSHPDNGEVQVKEEPFEDDSSTRSRKSISKITENMVNCSTKEHQWESEHDSNCDCKDCQPDKRRIQAESKSSVVVALESDNSKANVATSPSGTKVEYSSDVVQVNEIKETKFVEGKAHAQQQLTTTDVNPKPGQSSYALIFASRLPKTATPSVYYTVPQSAILKASPDSLKRTLPSSGSEINSIAAKHSRGVQVNPNTCSTCGRSFKRRDYLKQHQMTHSQERPFACDQCDRAFNQRSSLNVHLRTHSDQKVARCTWPDCTFTSLQSAKVIRHIRTAHFNLPQTKKMQTELGINDHRNPYDYHQKI